MYVAVPPAVRETRSSSRSPSQSGGDFLQPLPQALNRHSGRRGEDDSRGTHNHKVPQVVATELRKVDHLILPCPYFELPKNGTA